MIRRVLNTSRQLGGKDIMLIKGRSGKLSKEILGVIAASAAISMFFLVFLRVTANAIVLSYCENKNLIMNDTNEWMMESWINNISLASALFVFIVLSLFLIGQKLMYIKEIIQGIHALQTHRMDYEIPVEGDNELTELAETINYLSRTEREIQRKEAQLKKEREELIRDLSHDIRTPLTAILSYSEYMQSKENITPLEMEGYIEMMTQKAEQIRFLTNQLLDGGRVLKKYENGKFLMEQLVDEWESTLGEEFVCQIDFTDCKSFAGEFDVQELRRVFDNLASNIIKYAEKESIHMKIYTDQERLHIEQWNICKEHALDVESTKIGISSIRAIAERYQGEVMLSQIENEFKINISFRIL